MTKVVIAGYRSFWRERESPVNESGLRMTAPNELIQIEAERQRKQLHYLHKGCVRLTRSRGP